MSNAVLTPSAIQHRYKTYNTQLMTLWVTRQGQEFVTSGDLQLCDVELMNSTVALVGEPGIGNVGSVTGAITPHKATYNQIHAINDAGVTSTVYGITGENRVLSKTHLDHGQCSINIIGMVQGHQFRRDVSQPGNDMRLTMPTDNGILMHREKTWPSTPILMEGVKLQQSLRVETMFMGTWPVNKRIARFTEDWADTPGGTKRNADGTVRYFVNDDEGQSSTQECQVPSNCIDHIRLCFKITTRVDL